MSRYDGLIIPRSYSEYINKTDAATLQQALQLPGVLSGAVAAGDNKAVTSSAVNGALENCQKFKWAPEPFGSLKYTRIKYKQDDEPALLISFKGYTTILLNLYFYAILLKGFDDNVYGFKSGYSYNNFIYICYDGWRIPKILNVAGDECEIETITKDEYNVAETNGKIIKLMQSN